MERFKFLTKQSDGTFISTNGWLYSDTDVLKMKNESLTQFNLSEDIYGNIWADITLEDINTNSL